MAHQGANDERKAGLVVVYPLCNHVELLAGRVIAGGSGDRDQEFTEVARSGVDGEALASRCLFHAVSVSPNVESGEQPTLIETPDSARVAVSSRLLDSAAAVGLRVPPARDTATGPVVVAVAPVVAGAGVVAAAAAELVVAAAATDELAATTAPSPPALLAGAVAVAAGAADELAAAGAADELAAAGAAGVAAASTLPNVNS